MTPLWILLAVLIGLPLGFLLAVEILLWVASWSKPTRILPAEFWLEEQWVPVRVPVHERHWLARLLPGWGQTWRGHIYLDGRLNPKGEPGWIPGQVTEAWQLAHELWHEFDRHRMGDLRYELVALGDLWKPWRKRYLEPRAVAQQAAIMLDICTRVRCPALQAFDNAGMP